MNLLELKNINFRYQHGPKTRKDFNLSNINSSIQKGEFVSLLGPNGSGKSTLLKLISGLLIPDSGEVCFDGRNYKQFSRREIARKVAYVPQASLSIFPFSVYEIVMMGRTPYLNLFGFESEEDKKIVDEIMDLLEISHFKNHGINEISGGEAQLAYIARAFVQQPDIILLDEPNSHLDIKHQVAIFDIIKKLNREKSLTVISVSHDLNLASVYSDRIILIKNGSVYADDLTENIVNVENMKNVFEVDTEINFIPGTNSLNIIYKPFHTS